MEKKNVYEEVTEKMIEILESGVCPWKMPWKSKAQNPFPINIKSKKPYRGVNIILLLCSSFESNVWGTFNQLKDAGYSVKKGEKATKVIFWKVLDIEKKNEEGKIENDKVPLLKEYCVFNIQQTEEFVKESPSDQIVSDEKNRLEDCEKIISLFPLGMPEIKHAPGKAFYNPKLDFISIPRIDDYSQEEEYYQTFFHECVHATGHSSRLNRDTLESINFFGDDSYSREELIAEMGASFLSAFSGILPKTISNSAAYLQNWINALRGDSRLIISAACYAQRAVDYLVNIKFEAE